jgi:hypothetical protein
MKKKETDYNKETAIDGFAKQSGRGYTLNHVGCTEKFPPQCKGEIPGLGTYVTCKCGTELIIKREKSLWD